MKLTLFADDTNTMLADPKVYPFPTLRKQGSWEDLARAYGDIVADLGGRYERIENDCAQTKGHALAAAGHAARTEAMLRGYFDAIGYDPETGGPVVKPPVKLREDDSDPGEMRDRAPSRSDLEKFAQVVEDAADRITKPTPLAFLPMGFPPPPTGLTSERVRAVVREAEVEKVFEEVQETKKRRQKMVDDVVTDSVKEALKWGLRIAFVLGASSVAYALGHAHLFP